MGRGGLAQRTSLPRAASGAPLFLREGDGFPPPQEAASPGLIAQYLLRACWVLCVRPGAGWTRVDATWSRRGDTRTDLPRVESRCNPGAWNVLELREGRFGQCLQTGDA